MQYVINRVPAKISALSSGKTDKYEYLTGEEILYSTTAKERHSLGKPLEKQTKTIEKHGKKPGQALKSLEFPGRESQSIKNSISEKMLNSEIMNELGNMIEQKN